MILSPQTEIDDDTSILTFVSPFTDHFLVNSPLATADGSITSPFAADMPPLSPTEPEAATSPRRCSGPRSLALRALRASSLRHRHKALAAGAIADRERHRLSRDIHDVSGQYIVSMLFQLSAIEHRQADPTLLPALAELRATLTHFSEDLHGLAKGARRGVPCGAHLATALADLVSLWERQVGIVTRFRHRDAAQDGIDDRTAEAVFRIAQEALTNVAKHAASATLVTVSLGVKAGQLTLKIMDNATAPGPARFNAEHVRHRCGIAGMRQRATELGGTLTIRPRRDMPGTKLSATLPLQKTDAPAADGGAS